MDYSSLEKTQNFITNFIKDMINQLALLNSNFNKNIYFIG